MSESEMIIDCNENQRDFIIRKTSVEISRLPKTLRGNFLTEKETELSKEFEKTPSEEDLFSNIKLSKRVRTDYNLAERLKLNKTVSQNNSRYTEKTVNGFENKLTNSEEEVIEPFQSNSTRSDYSSEDDMINRLPKTQIGNYFTGIDTELSTESEITPCQQSFSDFSLPERKYNPDLAECATSSESVAEPMVEINSKRMAEFQDSLNRSWSILTQSEEEEEVISEPSHYDSLTPDPLSNDDVLHYTAEFELNSEVEKPFRESVLTIPMIKLPSKIHESRIKEIVTIKFQDNKLLFSALWNGLSSAFTTEETWSSIQDRTLIEQFLKKKGSYMYSKMTEATNRLMAGPLFTIRSLNKLVGKVTDENFDNTLLDCYLYAYIKNKNKTLTNCTKLERTIQKLLQRKVFIKKRCAQMIDLQSWVRRINSVDTKSEIRIENDVDLMPITEFQYIKERKPLDGYKVDENDPPVFCSCNPCNMRSGCCGSLNESEFAYTYDSKLKKTRTAIYECNSKCKCGPKCANRVVQHGRVQNLCIYRTPNGMGWGVKAEKKIKTGAFVCEYVGEVIYSDAAEVRGMAYDGEGFTYLFDLDFDNSELYTIDAYQYGNVSRFINHSCDPNLEVCPTWVGCLDPNMPRLALFTNRDIEKGEQLTIDYNITFQDGDTSNNSLCQKRKRTNLQVDSSASPSSNATGKVPVDPKTAANISENSEELLESATNISESSTKTPDLRRKSSRVLSLSSKKFQVPKLNEYPKHLASRAKNILARSRTSQRIASRRSFSSGGTGHNRKRIRCLCKSANCRKYLF